MWRTRKVRMTKRCQAAECRVWLSAVERLISISFKGIRFKIRNRNFRQGSSGFYSIINVVVSDIECFMYIIKQIDNIIKFRYNITIALNYLEKIEKAIGSHSREASDIL